MDVRLFGSAASARAAVVDANGNLMVLHSGPVTVSGIANPVTISSIVNPVAISPTSCDADESSTDVDDLGSVPVLSANPDRLQVLITNHGPDAAFISFGNTATTSHTRLASGQQFVFPANFVFRGDINAITDTGGAAKLSAVDLT